MAAILFLKRIKFLEIMIHRYIYISTHETSQIYSCIANLCLCDIYLATFWWPFWIMAAILFLKKIKFLEIMIHRYIYISKHETSQIYSCIANLYVTYI